MLTTQREVEIVKPGQEPEFSECIEPLLDRVRQGGWTRDIIVDLSRVSYLSSSNLTQLLKLRHAVLVIGVRVRLVRSSDHVLSEFSVTGLDCVFEFSPDESAARRDLAALAEGP